MAAASFIAQFFNRASEVGETKINNTSHYVCFTLNIDKKDRCLERFADTPSKSHRHSFCSIS